jgi:hypothetical protein
MCDASPSAPQADLSKKPTRVSHRGDLLSLCSQTLVVGWPEKPPYRFSLFSGPFLLKGRVQVVRDLFPTVHASIPDGMRFFRASKRQVPPFSVNSHPSVQNRSTFQLIYQQPMAWSTHSRPKKAYPGKIETRC